MASDADDERECVRGVELRLLDERGDRAGCDADRFIEFDDADDGEPTATDEFDSNDGGDFERGDEPMLRDDSARGDFECDDRGERGDFDRGDFERGDFDRVFGDDAATTADASAFFIRMILRSRCEIVLAPATSKRRNRLIERGHMKSKLTFAGQLRHALQFSCEIRAFLFQLRYQCAKREYFSFENLHVCNRCLNVSNQIV